MLPAGIDFFVRLQGGSKWAIHAYFLCSDNVPDVSRQLNASGLLRSRKNFLQNAIIINGDKLTLLSPALISYCDKQFAVNSE